MAWGEATNADAAPACCRRSCTASSAASRVAGPHDAPPLPPDRMRAEPRRVSSAISLYSTRPMSHIQDRLTSTLRRGPQALHLVVAVVDEDVAAGGAARAHRLRPLQEPDPHLEAEVVGQQRAHRADVGQVARVVVRDGAVLEGGDLGVVAAVPELEAVGAGDRGLEAQAARAEHAALGVEHDRPEVHDLALLDLLLGVDLAVVEPVLHVLVLQVALAGLVAHRAVDGVVDEQELEGRAVGLDRLLALGAAPPCRRRPWCCRRSAASASSRSRPGTCGSCRRSGRSG